VTGVPDDAAYEVFGDVLERNRTYADQHGLQLVPVEPRLRLVVVTCMDSRIDVLDALGLALGDVHIVRNVGARVTDDTIRSLAVSSGVLGTRYVLLLGHTNCGLTGTSDGQIRDRLTTAGADADAVASMQFLSVAELGERLRADAATLVASPVLPAGMWVAAGIFDVDTGRIDLIVEPACNVDARTGR
jgi:carbonic anhydrase